MTTSITTADQCKTVAENYLKTLGITPGRNIIVGDWSWVPYGCSYEPGASNGIVFGTNPKSIGTSGYIPITNDMITIADNFSKCKTMGNQYLNLIGKTALRDIQVGDWGFVPPGCSFQSSSDNTLHFNKNQTGNPSSTEYTSITPEKIGEEKDKIWKNAGCRTDYWKYTWNNSNNDKNWFVNDANAWASLTDDGHRTGCYGEDKLNWPGYIAPIPFSITKSDGSFEKNIGRYILIKRIDGKAEYINLSELEIYDMNGNKYDNTSFKTFSSTRYDNTTNNYISNNLIDGNTSKLAITKNSPDEWIMVDLGKNLVIGKMILVNRIDCCKERIVGCSISLININDTADKFVEVFTSNINEILDTYTYDFTKTINPAIESENNVIGRYIILKRVDNKNECININEIEVYNLNGDKYSLENDSSAIITASTNYDDSNSYIPKNAVDNNVKTIYHSKCKSDDWIKIDLKINKSIGKIIVKNRFDCCKDRIIGCRIYIVNNNDKIVYQSEIIKNEADIYTFIKDLNDGTFIKQFTQTEGCFMDPQTELWRYTDKNGNIDFDKACGGDWVTKNNTWGWTKKDNTKTESDTTMETLETAFIEKCKTLSEQYLSSIGKTAGREMQIGNWTTAPPGCSVNIGGDYTIHYNRNKNVNSSPDYKIISLIAYTDILNELNLFVKDLTYKVSSNIQTFYNNTKTNINTTAAGLTSSINDIKNKSVQEIIQLLHDIIEQVNKIGNETFNTIKTLTMDTVKKSRTLTNTLINAGTSSATKINDITNGTITNLINSGRDISRTARETMMTQLSKYKILMEQQLRSLNSETYKFSYGDTIYWILFIISFIWIFALIYYSIYKKTIKK
jgi:hypothetical protein